MHFPNLLNRYRIILLLLFLITTGNAQTIIPRFETLDVEDGLSQNSVYRIYQDKRGFMWFATADGLNRYDGENIRVFKSKNPTIAKANSNFIRGWLCEDRLGRIWYANETGIYFFNPIKEEIELAYDFLSETKYGFIYYNALFLDKNENLWIVNPVDGVVRFSIQTRQSKLFKFPESITQKGFVNLAHPAGDYLFLQHSSHPGNLRFNVYTEQYDWVFQEQPNVVARTSAQRLFVIQDRQLFEYDSTTRETQMISVDANNALSEVQVDSFSRIWTTSLGDGLRAYLPDQNRIFTYHHEVYNLKSLPSDITTCLFIDSDQNLWIGTDGGGVARIDLKPPRFNIFPLSQNDYPELNEYFIRSIFEGEDGRIWFGTFMKGLVVYDPVDGTIRKYSNIPGDKNSLPDNSVGVIFRDREGNTWIGHNKGLSLFDEKKNQFRQVPVKIPGHVEGADNAVFQLQQLSNGELLMTSFNGPYIIKKDGDGFYHGMNWKNIAINVTGATEMPDGHMWLASQFEGLFHVRPADTIAWLSERFLNKINIRSLHQDEQEPAILWLCSGTGLVRFDTRTNAFKLYDEKHGIPGSYVYGLIEDDDHNFWLSTNSGLCFYNRKNDTFQNFTVKDGLQSNEFNTGAFHKGLSGNIYFGGLKGFNWFRTGAEQSSYQPPRAGIISTNVNDVPVINDSVFFNTRSLTLAHHRNDISFEFAVFNYTRPEANKIQYKLDGWDEQWISTYQKSVRYSNLPSGKYTFHVRASSNDREWGKEDAVTIFIQAPFWKTTWFYGSLILISIGAIIGATRLVAQRKFDKRLREIEKQRVVLEERERISKDIHDDLGSGLSKISILSELAKQSKGMDEFTQRQLNKISESSHELIDNLSELIWSHSPANDSLKKLLWYIREHLSPIFDGTNTNLIISIPELPEDKEVPAAWRRNIFLVTKESLHNVLKHAGATQSSLTFSIDHEKLKIVMADNGKGFDVTSRLTAGNGLRNIRKRIMDCGGEVQIESSHGSGTILHIEVPLNF